MAQLRLRSLTMVKSIRSLTLVAVLSVTVVPAVSAENMGTNPKPQVATDQLSTLRVLQSTVFFLFGL
jgi:hypothetical protein